jgi:saccharopine dehydrogenase-like NADP-dependent oxidoreductase
VTVVDRSQQQLDRLETAAAVTKIAADITQGDALRSCLEGKFAVLSAAPYHATRLIAEAAKAAGAHYLDLTEDVASTRAVKQLAAGARTAFIPQCGLAPGFITIVASDLASRFDELQDVRMRVGALPKFPSNALNYNLTWSTDGVINEYCEPCEAIVNGQLRETQPLEELEEFSLDGVLYEAFNTSGGLGTLCETLAGKVRNLNYRTIRYPGPCGHHEGAAQRSAPARSARAAEGHPGERRAGHAAGRGDRVRHGQRHARRPAGAGDLREQDLCRARWAAACAAPSRSPPPAAFAPCSTC